MQAALDMGSADRDAPDGRADGGRRKISLRSDRVLIERSIEGIAMHVGVPSASYVGVALSLKLTESGARQYTVTLAHRDCDLSVVLHQGSDDAAALEWKQWARYFSLPRLVEQHDGTFERVGDPLGAIELGQAAPARRRGGWIARRRPRFLMRRRIGKQISACSRFVGEREIISYE